MTHGSKSKREHGSTGPGSTPGRVFPGLKAAGQMGNIRAKLRKVEVRAARLPVHACHQPLLLLGGPRLT
jgi:ribosomal protein L3